MPTYKTTKPITESFLEKLFTSVGKGLRSSMVKQLVKKDPELGKRIKDLEKTDYIILSPGVSLKKTINKDKLIKLRNKIDANIALN